MTVTGDLCADLLSNIASEQRAKVVYEYLYRQIADQKVKETIDFLLNREEAHNAMFRDAFNRVQDSGSNRDFGTTRAARMYFSMSEPSPSGNSFAGTDNRSAVLPLRTAGPLYCRLCFQHLPQGLQKDACRSGKTPGIFSTQSGRAPQAAGNRGGNRGRSPACWPICRNRGAYPNPSSTSSEALNSRL